MTDVFTRDTVLCLDGRISRDSIHPSASGGYADVYEGLFRNRRVAVKVMRPFGSSGRKLQHAKLIRRLWREYLTWSRLSHPNILACLGYSYDFSPPSSLLPSLVSPWMANGTITSYLEDHPEADRMSLMAGVADGLRYLHTREPVIVHGDVRAGNILVSDFGVPCLSDFGLSRVLGDAKGLTTTGELAGSVRWMSPELLSLYVGGVTVHSDVWAYGMTILEVLSGERPYADVKPDVLVHIQIKDGQLPSRPQNPKILELVDDRVWHLCQRCWAPEPGARASMQEVLKMVTECRTTELSLPEDLSDVDQTKKPTGAGGKRSISSTKSQITMVMQQGSVPDPVREEAKSVPSHNHDVAAVARRSRWSDIFTRFHPIASRSGKDSSSKVRLEIIEPKPGDHIAKEQAEVIHEKDTSVFNSLPRLYRTGKRALQWDSNSFTTGASRLYGNSMAINLGPDDDTTLAPVPARRRTAYALDVLNSYPIQGKIRIIDSKPVHTGGFSEVFLGKLHLKGKEDNVLVAMKLILTGADPGRDLQMIRQEIDVWTQLRHPNIIPFYGTVLHKRRIFMISPWAHNGTIVEYLKHNNPTADRRELLVQIANALSYIHNECKIVHGDVKGANIYISSTGDAMVADFGLSTHIEKLLDRDVTGHSIALAMTPRFSAPEVLLAAADAADGDWKPGRTIKSPASDVYAFGLVILQVYILERPWHEFGTEKVLAFILQGIKPPRPGENSEAVSRGLTPFIWGILENCLNYEPSDRPSMAALVVSLAEGSPLIGITDIPRERRTSLVVSVSRRQKGGHVFKVQAKGKLSHVKKSVRSQVQALGLIQHPHILPIFGTTKVGSCLFILTPWMVNGNIKTYLGQNPQADRMRLLHQTSDALSYLHSGLAAPTGPIFHGSIQPECIFIDQLGDVCVANFGLSNILQNVRPSGEVDAPVDNASLRFHPPEFFESEGGATAESDVYSFAMLMLQVLTDEIPFSSVKHHYTVISRIIKGKLPERPRAEGKAIDDSMWDLISGCWSYNPEERPSMDQVQNQLANAVRLKQDWGNSSRMDQQPPNRVDIVPRSGWPSDDLLLTNRCVCHRF